MTGTESHQGVAAFASEIEYATVEDLLAAAKAKGEPPFLVLSDGIEDPHNLGALSSSPAQALPSVCQWRGWPTSARPSAV